MSISRHIIALKVDVNLHSLVSCVTRSLGASPSLKTTEQVYAPSSPNVMALMVSVFVYTAPSVVEPITI